MCTKNDRVVDPMEWLECRHRAAKNARPGRRVGHITLKVARATIATLYSYL
jgi:hypothetical protein